MACADVIALDKGAEGCKWENAKTERSWPTCNLPETESLVSSSSRILGVRVKEPETVKVDCRVPAQRLLGQSEAHAAPGWYLFFTLYRSLHRVVFLSQRHLSRPDIIVRSHWLFPRIWNANRPNLQPRSPVTWLRMASLASRLRSGTDRLIKWTGSSELQKNVFSIFQRWQLETFSVNRPDTRDVISI